MSEAAKKDPSQVAPTIYDRLKVWWQSLNTPMWGKLVVMMALIFLASIGYLRSTLLSHDHEVPALTDEDIKSIDNRQQLPDLEFTTTDGNPKKLSDYRGKVLLLSFWASWCAPCLVEMPTFKELQNNLGPQGFEVITLNLDDNVDEAKDFIGKFWNAEGLPFQSFFDPAKKAAKHLQVDTLPSNFVVDRQGRLVFTATGANDWSKGPTLDLLHLLLAEK